MRAINKIQEDNRFTGSSTTISKVDESEKLQLSPKRSTKRKVAQCSKCKAKYVMSHNKHVCS